MPFSDVGYGVYWPDPERGREEKFDFDASMTSEQMGEEELELERACSKNMSPVTWPVESGSGARCAQ